MNWQSSRIVDLYIKWIVFTLFFFSNVSVKAWEVDLSRRQRYLEQMRKPASVPASMNEKVEPAKTEDTTFWKAVVPEGLLSSLQSAAGEAQNVVILHTENGFVPETVPLKKGMKYRIHVVNINEKEKNVSFVVDAFSEQHSAYFGKEKVFEISPKTGGVFSFLCPESAKQGKFVVLPDDDSRKPASP